MWALTTRTTNDIQTPTDQHSPDNLSQTGDPINLNDSDGYTQYPAVESSETATTMNGNKTPAQPTPNTKGSQQKELVTSRTILDSNPYEDMIDHEEEEDADVNWFINAMQALDSSWNK